jgi:Flp pilus assembly protein TadG
LVGLNAETGQAALEVALAVPLFLAVVFGVIQASLLLQTYCNATYACRNAARYASLHSTTSLAPSSSPQIQSMVQSGLFLNASITPTISVNYFNSSNLASGTTNLCLPPVNSSLNVVGNVVCVQATWKQQLKIPFLSNNSVSVSTQTYKIISR